MKTELSHLTSGRAQLLIRSLGLIGITFGLVGILLLLLPPPEMPALKDVAQASPRRFVNNTLLFPKYRDLASTRPTPFEFQELVRIKVQLRVKPEPPPPPPKPDVTGLTLVGTAPGTPLALAVLNDEQSGQVTNIGPGDKIRNSVVKDILADKIVLALDAEEAELALTPIKGSENLQRQLQGLPPLPGQQASEKKSAPVAKPPSMPTQTSSSAVLVGASSAGRMPTTVVTQSAPNTRATSQRSRQSSRPGSPSQPGTQSSPSNQNSATGQPGGGAMQNQGSSSQGQPSSQNSATGQSGGDSMQNQGASPQSQSSNRSLGISGYMLSLEKQQELGLNETGLLITSVRDSSSPIQPNDVILSIAGKSFGSLGEAKNLLQSVSGSSVQLNVYRNGAATQISAPLK